MRARATSLGSGTESRNGAGGSFRLKTHAVGRAVYIVAAGDGAARRRVRTADLVHHLSVASSARDVRAHLTWFGLTYGRRISALIICGALMPHLRLVP